MEMGRTRVAKLIARVPRHQLDAVRNDQKKKEKIAKAFEESFCQYRKLSGRTLAPRKCMFRSWNKRKLVSNAVALRTMGNMMPRVNETPHRPHFTSSIYRGSSSNYFQRRVHSRTYIPSRVYSASTFFLFSLLFSRFLGTRARIRAALRLPSVHAPLQLLFSRRRICTTPAESSSLIS